MQDWASARGRILPGRLGLPAGTAAANAGSMGTSPTPLVALTSKRVLLVVADPPLAELLAEALCDAGHVVRCADSTEVMAGEVDSAGFDAAIVDLDTWAREGCLVVERIRLQTPATLVIALLPCGGNAADYAALRHHLALEKPARLRAVLSAIDAGPRVPRSG